MQLLHENIPCVAQLYLSSMFSRHKNWTSQLSPLIGEAEVAKLGDKLRSLSVTGLEQVTLSLDMFFTDRTSAEAEVVKSIGSWTADNREQRYFIP